MTTISFKGDVKEVERYLKRLGPKVVKPAANASLNKTIKTVRTTATREISAETGIKPQKKARENLKITRSNFRTMTAFIQALPFAPNLIKYVAPSKRRYGAFASKTGVVAKAWGNKKTYKGTFIGSGRGSGTPLVYRRTGPTRRSAIEAVPGPSVPSTFVKEKITSSMERIASAQWLKNMKRELKFRLSKQ